MHSLVCHSCTFDTLALSYSCTILLLNTWEQIFQGGTEYFIFSAEIFSPGVPNISSGGTKLGGTKFFMTALKQLQNGRDGVKYISWCHSHFALFGWFLGVPFLHVLVFIQKLEVFSEDTPRAALWYNCGTKWP